MKVKLMMRKFKVHNVTIEKEIYCVTVFFKIDLSFLSAMLETSTLTKTGERGSLLIVLLLCEDNHDTCRYSQPLLQGNLSMTSTILLYGNTFQRLKEV